eukprot:6482237-Amphidinium_carterae.2
MPLSRRGSIACDGEVGSSSFFCCYGACAYGVAMHTYLRLSCLFVVAMPMGAYVVAVAMPLGASLCGCLCLWERAYVVAMQWEQLPMWLLCNGSSCLCGKQLLPSNALGSSLDIGLKRAA